ncbi:YbhB/YbcL family Raf kinase inhibitor-like protein [Massilia sp. BJB1822]|uniref:YbhB/YbcL family Raf kinase inhibitor-like protein n=1 Tax=Massilia sp. BJB1822 TaxID=2744470 RepID=UPI001593CE9B|nr:YbhB/YbcL family Raf kinase inhibitor-like protein [Massilia sp. BJB1822]NVE00897.1 YbhB/YbcL family Raf kinase inhibitor-like protein [Massilia sp. BJB1822]
MKLWSESFKDGDPIPGEFAFAVADPAQHARLSANLSPHLAWDEVPPGTASLALFCIDGDAPQDGSDVNRDDVVLPVEVPRGDFFHWTLIDIPPGVTALAAGQFSRGVTAQGKTGPAIADGGHPWRQGLNDYTAWFAGDAAMAGDYYGYDGPCPPWNDMRVHHYVFRLYALDIPRLELEGRFAGPDALRAMHGHILDEAQWIGTYTLYSALAKK